VVSGGKIVMVEDDDGNHVPLQDDGPTLAAIVALDRLIDRRCKVLGLYAPTRVVAETSKLKREISSLIDNLCDIDDTDEES
jgi:hypothetical protein